MSGPGKSAKPIRQLSLQPPAPHRQQIRRQRSAEDDKLLQICASPLAHGKHSTGKLGFERPKVRVAWSENRRKNEKELEQVEVVARQIPGRARPATGKSRGYAAIEKPPILCSRQELAERLRQAWKHREENKTNINIFLAHGTVEERCDSEMSSHASVATPSPPLLNNKENEAEIPDSGTTIQKKQPQKLESRTNIDADYVKKEGENVKTNVVLINDDESLATKFPDELSGFADSSDKTRKMTLENEVSEAERSEETRESDLRETEEDLISRGSNIDKTKKETSTTADCSSTLPSIKIENSPTPIAKMSKDDFSSAKQKRASFHRGANRAFLDPIQPSVECKWNSVSEKVSSKITVDIKTEKDVEIANLETTDVVSNDKITISNGQSEFKCATIVERTAIETSLTTERNMRTKPTIENKDLPTDNKTTQKINDSNKVAFSAIRKAVMAGAVAENKDGSVIEKSTLTRQISEVRCSSVNERQPPSKKMEGQKVDQKSRRTSSAPPQRQLGNVLNNRMQVNIVIDTPNSMTFGKNSNKEKSSVDKKDNGPEGIEVASTKVPSQRAVRSAPLKKRSRSVKKRFCGAGSCKNDEEGKSRNRSTGRGKNSIDSRTIDIVTMVSLVSSADSDSDTENSLRDDKLINELRSKLPTTSIIKTSMNSVPSIARKPIKSVSFQRNSCDEDPPKEQQPLAREEKKATQPRLAIVNHRGNGSGLSTEETLPWKTDIPGLALPVLALIRDAEEAHDVPLTDREKRCLAVPIGDLHDKKRKLLKTRSTPSRSEMEKQMSPKIKVQESPRIVSQKIENFTQLAKNSENNSPGNVKQAYATASKETVQQIQLTPTEPQFQTNKEKECWHLYRKMCDKGVCVSFDTVLRGMLTPTEYRLRQKELFQSS